ncbi:MAG: trypsin-like peptidase domain-containing protein, partial [Bdellovibrionales bacterium]
AVIVLNDGREFDAQIILIDEASDIALLKVEAKDLPFATLKPSETLEVGDLVLAIGNPFGVGQTVTSGIVSALARSSFNINDINFFIQTDAAINPGNSGGPLVDMSGHVVGINTAIYSRDGGSLGIGFSVPSEMVQTIITAEKTGAKNDQGNIKRPWLGVTTQKVTSDIAGSLGLDRPTGSLISALHPQSPLAKKGLEVGDIVTHINDKEIRDAAEMQFRLLTVAIGEKVKVTYQREDQRKSANITMIAAPDLPDRKKTKIAGNNVLQGAHICVINPALQEELAIKLPNEGVVVCGMENRAYAQRLLRTGDVLITINGEEVIKPWDVQQIADRLDNRQGIRITLIRNGQKQVIALR